MQVARPFSIVVTLLVLILGLSCSKSRNTGQVTMDDTETEISGVVLLIGDGMGLAQVSTRFYYGEGEPQFARFPYIGLINTSSSAEKVTDSASGATAFSTGQKTYNGAIGVGPDREELPTILEQLSAEGWATGLVATSSIVHATPASFYAHVPRRSQYEKIAEQLVDSDVDFFAGGGKDFFFHRKDEKNLYQPLVDQGFQMDTVALDPEATYDVSEKYGFILADDGMPPILEGRGDFLPNATRAALDYLSQNDKGFFLMVEGSQIDWGGHANEFAYLVTELQDFDKTIGLVLDFAEARGDILVVVTADHETGGLSLSADADNYQEISPTFSTGGHSATLIPVFAYGPGAENFAGIYENTDIYHKINAMVHGRSEPGLLGYASPTR